MTIFELVTADRSSLEKIGQQCAAISFAIERLTGVVGNAERPVSLRDALAVGELLSARASSIDALAASLADLVGRELPAVPNVDALVIRPRTKLTKSTDDPTATGGMQMSAAERGDVLLRCSRVEGKPQQAAVSADVQRRADAASDPGADDSIRARAAKAS